MLLLRPETMGGAEAAAQLRTPSGMNLQGWVVQGAAGSWLAAGGTDGGTAGTDTVGYVWAWGPTLATC